MITLLIIAPLLIIIAIALFVIAARLGTIQQMILAWLEDQYDEPEDQK